MADTREFFETYLPNKLTSNPALASSVKASFQFVINDAGTWSLDLTTPPGSVKEGAIENPACTITVAKADWEAILDNPGKAMQMFMMGKLKVGGQMALAMQLQKILA